MRTYNSDFRISTLLFDEFFSMEPFCVSLYARTALMSIINRRKEDRQVRRLKDFANLNGSTII